MSPLLVPRRQSIELHHEKHRLPVLSLDANDDCMDIQVRSPCVTQEGQDAPEVTEKIHSQICNEDRITNHLPFTGPRVHGSEIIVKDTVSKAWSEDTIVAEPEEETIQQIRDDLTIVIQECMGDAEPMLGSDRIDKALPCCFSRIAEDHIECLSVNVASPQFNPLEHKKSDLLKTTGEDCMEVQEALDTAPIVDPAKLMKDVATSCKVTLLGQSPKEQCSITMFSSTEYQSQGAFCASCEPPSRSFPPIQRIRWWIKFVKDNYSKLARNTTGLFMSSMPNFEYAYLTLKQFLPNEASLMDSWLNDDIVMSMIQLLFSTQGNVFLTNSQVVAAAHVKGNPKLLEYDASAE